VLFQKRAKIIGIFFVIPAFLIYTIFFFYPIIRAVIDSLYDYTLGANGKEFIGLKNYSFIFQESAFIISIKNTFIVMLVSLLIHFPLAFLFALFINKELKGFRFFRTVYFMPSIISTVVIGIIWSLIYDPYMGLLNNFLNLIGLEEFTRSWLGEKDIAFGSILVVNVWQWFGYIMIIVLAGIKSLPNDIVEAAIIDGVNSSQKLFYITIPLLKWTIQVCLLIIITGSLKIFDLVYVMTGGGPGNATEVMATYMWEISFVSLKYGAGNAVAVVILILSFMLVLISNQFAKDSNS
jgi:raffinose/stachyose/melibiose transport system permease protein